MVTVQVARTRRVAGRVALGRDQGVLPLGERDAAEGGDAADEGRRVVGGGDAVVGHVGDDQRVVGGVGDVFGHGGRPTG